MQCILLLSLCFLLAACGPAIPHLTSNAATAVQSQTAQTTISMHPTSTYEPTRTPGMRVFTPVATNTPWIFPSGLSIEEHPLAKQPEIEPLVFYPLDALSQTEVWQKHKYQWGNTLSPNEYYSVGMGNVWVMQGKDKLEAVWGITENGKVDAQVTRNGIVIFSKFIQPPGTTSPYRVLTVYDNHWVFEIAQEKVILPNTQTDSFFSSDIFVDGQSIDDLHRNDSSYGFQTIHSRPFYFYKREGKIGISYDGNEVPLGYDGVWHYGCCSGGALNPRMAKNIIGFFAWRGDKYYYTEIGVYDQP